MKIANQSVQLLSMTPDAEKLIELAGRTCYKSEDKITDASAGEFVRRMVKSGHHSTLEHCSASFKIICSRGMLAEITRHRIGCSYSVESTRFCSYSKEKFDNQITIMDNYKKINLSEENIFLWEQHCIDTERLYLKFIADGIKPEHARDILPIGLKTEISMTATFRAWRHFLSLRMVKAAHPQIQEIAKMIQEILVIGAKNCFYDLTS